MARSSTLTSLGKGLRRLREARGWTQEQLATKAGFGSKYVSEIERGLRDPPATTLVAFATALGATLDDLVDGVRETALTKRDSAGNETPPKRQKLPATVELLAEQIGKLDPKQRRTVVGLVRRVLSLVASAR